MLQCVAVHCSVLRHVSCWLLKSGFGSAACVYTFGSVLRCVAVCCSGVECVARAAVCSCMLQCVAVCCSGLQFSAVCCSVLQWVAAGCSVLYHVICWLLKSGLGFAICLLQYVAVCCSVLQRGTVCRSVL